MANLNRKYETDVDYFEKIDTPEKAYILGFLASDGCNRGSDIVFEIKKKDEEVLCFIRDCISPDRPIYVNDNTDFVRLVIYSKKMCNDLEKIGITKAKTKTIKFPEIDDKFLPDFLRGCFDGDGCVSLNRHKGIKAQIRFGYCSASLDFLKKFEEILRQKCNLKERKIYKNHISDCYSIEYEGSIQVKKIYNYLYDDSCFSLSRKRNKFSNYYGIISASTCI